MAKFILLYRLDGETPSTKIVTAPSKKKVDERRDYWEGEGWEWFEISSRDLQELLEQANKALGYIYHE